MSEAPILGDYALWLVPSKEDSKPLSNLITHLAKLEPSSPSFTPHITLWYPIPKAGAVGQIEHKLREIVKEMDMKNLELHLEPAQKGDKYFQSVLSPVKPTDDLLDLRRKCQEEWGEEEKVYFPHLSLFYGDFTPERRDQIALEANKTKDFDIDDERGKLLDRVKVEEIVIVDTEGRADQWRVVGSVKV